MNLIEFAASIALATFLVCGTVIGCVYLVAWITGEWTTSEEGSR